MKKSLIPAALSLSLLSSTLLPGVSAYAKEPDQSGIQKEISSEPEFDYNIKENDLTGVSTIEVNYKGEETTAYYNENTGDVLINNEIVAKIKKNKRSYTDDGVDEAVSNNLVQPLAVAGAKYYTIGTEGSGIYNFKYDDEVQFR